MTRYIQADRVTVETKTETLAETIAVRDVVEGH